MAAVGHRVALGEAVWWPQLVIALFRLLRRDSGPTTRYAEARDARVRSRRWLARDTQTCPASRRLSRMTLATSIEPPTRRVQWQELFNNILANQAIWIADIGLKAGLFRAIASNPAGIASIAGIAGIVMLAEKRRV